MWCYHNIWISAHLSLLDTFSCSVMFDFWGPHGLIAYQASLSMEFSMQEYWSGYSLLQDVWSGYSLFQGVFLCLIRYMCISFWGDFLWRTMKDLIFNLVLCFSYWPKEVLKKLNPIGNTDKFPHKCFLFYRCWQNTRDSLIRGIRFYYLKHNSTTGYRAALVSLSTTSHHVPQHDTEQPDACCTCRRFTSQVGKP